MSPRPRTSAPAVVDDPELRARQARRNALRSFLTGLAIDVAVAIAALAVTLTSSADAWEGWAAVGLSLSRTVVQAAGSYVLRRFVDPSGIPVPLPIAPAAAPVELEGGGVVPSFDN